MKRATKQRLRAEASITAMKALIESSGFWYKYDGKRWTRKIPRFTKEEIAHMAVSYADALMAELNKKGGLK